ncbi:MAG TPA: DHA2 family efflux MFS transporter permease subunit [Gaiellaceae bacterium]|jgi:EmrB/QacA subfamily drug resistance transporter|nr:DHA2 family efflux MFS transporter permease subunit [Gaiellaceae bacterium]
MKLDRRTRWLALYVLCLGDLMIVLDATIVNVALPSIRADLGFSSASLAWVLNAYLLTFGGFLLLGGRLGDLFGHRRLFLIGIGVFTLASLACGLSTAQNMLIAARAVQGLGGAVVSAVALSLLLLLFQEPAERTKAMGFFGFVMAGGGSIGVLLGGVLTDVLSWHWIFLVNIPVGIAVFALSIPLLPRDGERGRGPVDVAGAVTVTLALMLAVYAIVNGNGNGWLSGETLGLLAAALILFGVFLTIESRTEAPLVPLALFRNRNLSVANGVGVLWSAGMFAWFFFAAQYLGLVLGYDPLHVGLAFLPANVIMGAFSLGLSARIVMRYGTRLPIGIGMALVSLGLLLFARAPVDGSFWLDVLPTMVVLGIGVGMAMNPVLIAAMSDVEPSESGLASGIVNTGFMMGGALGLAVLASLAAWRTGSVEAASKAEALNSGYHLAFLVGSVFAGLASALAVVLLRDPSPEPRREGAPALVAEIE